MEPWARLVVQQLNEVGIDAVLRILEWGIFRDQTGRGQFEAATDWDGCGSVVEPWFGMQRFHKKWVNPVGTAGHRVRGQHQQRRPLGQRRILRSDRPDGKSACGRPAGHGPDEAGRDDLGRRTARHPPGANACVVCCSTPRTGPTGRRRTTTTSSRRITGSTSCVC